MFSIDKGSGLNLSLGYPHSPIQYSFPALKNRRVKGGTLNSTLRLVAFNFKIYLLKRDANHSFSHRHVILSASKKSIMNGNFRANLTIR